MQTDKTHLIFKSVGTKPEVRREKRVRRGKKKSIKVQSLLHPIHAHYHHEDDVRTFPTLLQKEVFSH
jgi:hypothetical protein